VAYASTRRNGADRDIWVMNPSDPSTDRLLVENSGGGWSVRDWSPDDSQLLVTEYISVNKSNIWLVDVASGNKSPLTETSGNVSWEAGEFAVDGASVYLSSDEHGEFKNLLQMKLDDRSVTLLTQDLSWDVEDFDLSDDGKWIALTVNEAGVSRLYLLETATGAMKPVEGLPAGQVFGLEWHTNNRDLGFNISSARSTSDVWSLDIETREVTRWTESELGGLVAGELSEPELISWKSHDGLEISGFLYRPPAQFTGPRPVIINIHGGPEGQARPGFLGRNNYFLNELGTAIIYPNVRGSTGFGKTFVTLDNALKREDSVRDIGALLDWIGEQPGLDADRIMVTGGSYGGYMTLAVAVHYNDRIRCALDVVGISNFATFLKNTEDYRRDLRRVEYGDERDPEIAAFFEEIAPLNNAERITKPLFIVQGANDPRVPLSEAEQMLATVKGNNTPAWYLMARDEGHGFRKKANADFQFYATVLFVRKFLLDEDL
jgi:dipeptidyl aminopeptidase/acylaminoacyl peptidase